MNAQNKWLQSLAITAIVFIVYYFTSTHSTAHDHYVRLADAFLHGRNYILDPPDWLELIRIDNKGYVIDPPAPVLFLIPWVAIWHLHTNQVLISMLLGASSAGIFWLVTQRLGWTFPFRSAMTILVAFGTNLWWVSDNGGVWMMAHASAVFFLMAALLEATGKHRPWLLGLLVGLAGLSRLPVFLSFPFFAYMVGRGLSKKEALKHLAMFGSVLAFVSGLYLLYTYSEFGTLTLAYDKGQFISEPIYTHGLFSLSYIPRQLHAILFNAPDLTSSFPYFRPSSMGLALFVTTPILLYMFRASLGRMELMALASIALVSIPILTYGATGFAQFGYRFSLDVLPFMILLTASGMKYSLSPFKILLVALCCAVNLWGVLLLR